MKGKNLIILMVVAVAMVALATKTTKKHAKVPPSVIGKNVFPALVLDDVDKVTVVTAGGAAAVVRTDDRWTVPDRYNYQADFNKVKDCLMKISDLKIGQVVKVNDRQKAAMKLIPPAGAADKGSTGTLVELSGKGGAKSASLLVGDARTKKMAGEMDFGGYPDGQFISPDGGKNIYLVNATFTDLPQEPVKWLDQDLLNVAASDIRDITITGTDGKEVKVVRKKEGSGMEVAGVATNETTVESKMYSLESAFSYLKLDDVADPAAKPEATGLDKPAVFTATTQKGEIYSMKIGKTKDGSSSRYCRLEVSLTEAEKQPEAKTDEEKKKAEQAAKDRKELEDKTKALNGKLSKWTYLVAQSKLDTMMSSRDSLVEKKKEEKKEDEKKKEAPAAASGDDSPIVPPEIKTGDSSSK